MMDSIYFINNSNLTNIQSSSSQSSIDYLDDKLFELTWNEILYDGGLAAWGPRLSFRWLTICVCLIGVLGKINLFSIFIFLFFRKFISCLYVITSTYAYSFYVYVFNSSMFIEYRYINICHCF